MKTHAKIAVYRIIPSPILLILDTSNIDTGIKTTIAAVVLFFFVVLVAEPLYHVSLPGYRHNMGNISAALQTNLWEEFIKDTFHITYP